MTRRRTCPRGVWLIALLCAMLQTAVGDDGTGPEPESTVAPGADGAGGRESAFPTLDELKAMGAARSSYRNHQVPSMHAKAPKARLAAFRKDIEPILRESCVQCHGPDTQEGNIRIDTLDPDLPHGDDVSWWVEVFAVLSNGEMPPADTVELTDEDRSRVIEWLSSELQTASMVRRAEQAHSSFRRMTRYEYNYALQDLLGLPFDFARDLPPESASEDGFQNSSEMLHMSAIQFATYREIARKALQRATVRGEQAQPIFWGVSMKAASADAWAKQERKLKQTRQKHKDDPDKQKEELQRQVAQFQRRHGRTHYKNLMNGRTARAPWRYSGAKYAWKPMQERPEVPSGSGSDYVAVIPPRQKLTVELGNRIPDEGTLRVRVRASRTSVEENRLPSLQLEFGWQASNNSAASVTISDSDIGIDAAPDKPQFYQWDVPLSEIYPRNPMRRTAEMGQTPSPSEYLRLVNSSVSKADVQIDYIEVTAPVYEQWPPASHSRIFIDSADEAEEFAYAREVLTSFMSRAWRRRVTDSEVDQKLALFRKIRPACDDFQEAMIEVLATVLSSPKFLYLVQSDPGPSQSETLSPDELATRLSSLVLSTDGGTGTPRGAQTLSFNRSGRAIPAEHRPKRIFDMLFVRSDEDAARRLALSQSALDDLLADARSLRRTLSTNDQKTLDEYLQSVRDTEVKVEKAKRWMDIPLPTVDADHLKLDITPEEPRVYLQTMFELIYLAFKTDSTRVVSYQIGRENGVGISDYLARAVGFNLTHQLSHKTKDPDGWKNFGTYCRFLSEEYGRFAKRLKATPEPGGGTMLENTLLLFGSASSAFHLSRNYPLILTGGKNMGFRHGRYLNYGPDQPQGGPWKGGTEPWQKKNTHEDIPLSNLFVTMLQRLGVETERFSDSTGTIADV